MLRRGPFVRAVAAVVLVLQAAACAPHRVDTPLGIAPGDRVRVTNQAGAAVTGRALALHEDTLDLDTGDGTTSVAAGSVQRLEVRQGSHGHAGVGAIVGLVIGGIAGAALIASAGDGGDYAFPPEVAIAPVLVIGGLLLGTIVGAAARGDNWVEVPTTALAEGWTYGAVTPALEPASAAGVGAATVDSAPRAVARVSLGSRARVVGLDSAVTEVADAWASLDSVGGTRGNTGIVGATSVAFPRAQTAGVLVPRGRHGHALVGLGMGLFLGASGGALGCAIAEECEKAGGLIGGVLGATLGLLIGGQIKSDTWVAVDLDALVPLSGIR
jgi:hypothetical protein